MASSPEPKDYEEETFEDASDGQAAEANAISHSNSTRSLTDRRTSNGSPTTPRAEESSFPAVSDPSHPRSGPHEDEGDDVKSTSTHSEAEDTPRRRRAPKSPLLTTHRLSTSSLDDVNLANNKDDEHLPQTSSLGQELQVESAGPATSTSPDSDSKQTTRSHGFSASFPSIPWSTSATNNKAAASPTTSSMQPAPSAPGRKLTSPFSWLSRSTSSPKDAKSPAGDEGRRNTAASISTLNSNPDMLGRLPEGDESDNISIGSKKPARNSLKDQFKLLRMRDEGGLPENDQTSVASGHASHTAQSIGSPPSIAEEQEEEGGGGGGVDTEATSPPLSASIAMPSSNPNLLPGTVSGASASATDASVPVDWELWQQIVNNGAEALNGANSDELEAAIKRGIPQTIRGVIWQILADSRNAELEDVYRDLVARGTDKERERHRSVNGRTNGSVHDRDISSSRSSIRSDRSGSIPPPISNNGTPSSSPSLDKDAEKILKDQAVLEAARKKAKDDADAIRKLEKTIRRDLGSRTSYSKYFVSQGNQEALFGLCKAYALYDDAVGYAQGINFIAMPLLFNMDEGEAFTLLVKLMSQYRLREQFIQDMPRLHLHLYQFERLLEDLEPALFCHLRRSGVNPQLYATQWFLTLFAYRFPLQLVLRIYDLVFMEGLESAILRFAVAVMRRNADTLLGMKDMGTLSTFLKEKLFDVYIDQQPSANSILESGFFGSAGGSDKEIYRADVMVQDAFSVPLTKEMISTYTTEWEEKVRLEKEREAELENLRHTVASQAARIRSLEERTEKSDQEHVQLASELVRVKVENEELQDANESLQVQVRELKIVVDKQPAEVEEKLRTEMDRIMNRNIEVQNENRAMEEQMAEMEKDLVDTKMKWAELFENHETLKQKWSDLRRALD